MAKSGVITLTGSDRMTARILWEYVQDIYGNYSEITAQLEVKQYDSDAVKGTFTGRVNISGTADGTVSETGEYYGYATSEYKNLATIAATVEHDSAGRATVTFQANVTGPVGDASVYQTITLDQIPKEIDLSTAPNFTDEQNPTITYLNDAGTGIDTLTAAILSADGTIEFAAHRAVPKDGNSYTFVLTETERNAMRNATPDSDTMEVIFQLVGTFGSTRYVSNMVRTLTIVNAGPTVAYSFLNQTSSLSSSLTGNSDTLIRYVSNVAVKNYAAAKKGASIVSREISCGGKAVTADGSETVIFEKVESGQFVFSAVDSRGNRTDVPLEQSIVDYIPLSCVIGASAPDTDGNYTFKVSGNFFNKSFGAKTNTLSVQYRWKKAGEIFSAWISMSVTKSGDSYSAYQDFSGLDYRANYVFQARAMDLVYTSSNPVITAEKNIASTPIFDWSGEDMRINVPLKVDGDLDVNGDFRINDKPFDPEIYAVGDIYLTLNTTSPAARFGGTWEQITNRFLLAAGGSYTAGGTGGSATVTLTVEQMPAHNHSDAYIYQTMMYDSPEMSGLAQGENFTESITGGVKRRTLNSAGSGQPHDNMPPYLVVYMWKRVS